MAHLEGQELFDRQYDMLWESTESNPQLPSSDIPAQNKALETGSKRVIGAVNEVKKISETAKSSLASMAKDYNEVIGDFGTDPTLLEKLKEVDGNIILSIVKIFKTLNNGKALPEVEPDQSVIELITSMKAEIEALKLKVEELEASKGEGSGDTSPSECQFDRSYQVDKLEYSSSKTYQLSKTGIILDDFELLVNGLEYYINESFTVDNETGILTWTSDGSSGGLDLDADFEIVAQYWYKNKTE